MRCRSPPVSAWLCIGLAGDPGLHADAPRAVKRGARVTSGPYLKVDPTIFGKVKPGKVCHA